MVETLKLTLCIEMSMNINSLLYFLKRVPMLNKCFDGVGYEHNSLAKGFVTVSLIYETIKMILKVGLLLLLGIVLPMIYVQYQYENVQLQDTYNHLYLTLYILLPFVADRILGPSPRKFICVKVMKMNARNFVIADYLPQDILRFLLEMILFSFVARVFDLKVILVLLLIVAKHCYSIAYEALHILSYQKTGKFFHKRIAVVSIYMLAVLALAYSCSLLNLVLHVTDLVLIGIGLIGVLVGLWGGRYLLQYAYYDLAFNDANVLSELSIDRKKIKAEAGFARVKLNEKEYSQSDLVAAQYNHKSGFEYMNAIFFERHRRVLMRPILIELALVGATLLITLFVLMTNQEAKGMFVDTVLKRFPAIIFISYLMSTGSKATKAMFYNCDISLLRYGFYRESGSVLATFSLRVQHIIGSNLVPAAAIAVGLFLLELLVGGSGRELLPVGLLAIAMSIFFSVHNMVLYYLLQPYATDLSVKSPTFTVINFFTYFFSYICMQLETAPENFLFFTVLGTAVYVVLALIFVYRLAPNTFKVK